jgi:glycosyltransferase involved in cell wall biosynthesis
MKIVMIDPSAFTPPYDHHLCEGLSQIGHNVSLFTTDFEYVGWESENPYRKLDFFYNNTNKIYSKEDRSWHRQAIKGSEHVFNMLSLLIQIKKLDPDIIHFQWLPIPVLDTQFISVLKKFTTVVHTVHDTTPYHGATPSRLQVWGARSVPQLFERVIVHTDNGKDTLVNRGIAKSKVSVIPHGPIRYPESSQNTKNGYLSDTDSKQTILFFGGIKKYKGVDILLRSFASLPSKLQSQTELKIAGSASIEMKSLYSIAARLGIEEHVKWDIRYIPDEEVPMLFESADLVVFPYRNADQSGALMTALPYGKPIVATDVGGFSKILTDDVHGYLVEPESPESLSTALEKVLLDESKQARMSDAVLNLSENVYSWERIAEQTVQVYKTAI